MLSSPVFAKLQSRPSCSLHPESFDPAKSSLFPSSMDHGSRITTLPAVVGIAPCLHSTSFFSVASGFMLHNRGLQLICLQSFADSFHCNRGVYPHSPQKPVALQRKRFYPLFLYALTHPFSNNEGGTYTPPFLQKSSTKMKRESTTLASRRRFHNSNSGGMLTCRPSPLSPHGQVITR
jgi:hypothetical protein